MMALLLVLAGLAQRSKKSTNQSADAMRTASSALVSNFMNFLVLVCHVLGFRYILSSFAVVGDFYSFVEILV